MNLYKLHTKSKSLDHHDAAHESVAQLFWWKYFTKPKELKKREAAFTKDVEYAYKYAVYVLNGRFPAAEELIAKDAKYACDYARFVLGRPFPDGEAAIAKDAQCSLTYAKDVLKGPFPAGEKAITAGGFANQYRDFLATLSKK